MKTTLEPARPIFVGSTIEAVDETRRGELVFRLRRPDGSLHQATVFVRGPSHFRDGPPLPGLSVDSHVTPPWMKEAP